MPSELRRSTLTTTDWDVIVVGAGHNGLTCAAYLARDGRRVLVLEARRRIGGACTLQHPFQDSEYVISPCAYVVGLLHPLVVEELGLRRYGYRVHLIDPHLWCPFEDGTALTLWNSPDRNRFELEAFAPHDVEGYLRYEQLFSRIRASLRAPSRDTWLGDAPSRVEIEALLGDGELIEVLFEESIASVVERHVRDERLRIALHGQGLIGTWAGPRDAGTAAIHAFHSMGSVDGRGGSWGYVEGGMGRISFSLAAAAEEAGATVLTSAPVSEIAPGEVRLSDGTNVRARAVVSNADPRTTLDLCEAHATPGFRDRVQRWRIEGPVLKVNCALRRLPHFIAATSAVRPERAMVTIAGSIDETQAACETSRSGVAAPHWAELYVHSAYDPTVAPRGRHSMSVFAQYAPYHLASGTWDECRDAVADELMNRIARFAPDIEDCIEERQVLAPPDIESAVGLRGGHIFQGECLPDQMWQRRFTARTPMPGVYMCGAATHPGGSVIAANGRNAASAVLEDLRQAEAQPRALTGVSLRRARIRAR
ncbi:MAG: NAD(P)/FAD-dependent oxidoreductase [Candidatus Dormibacteraeota bacterium]|nr:NAD(P)/FAD-dependent oxidoreductase [Candidatus Dormibacteraeota bacterium]